MVPVVTSSTMLAAMPLPMPAMARSCLGSCDEGGELGGLLLDGLGGAAVGADAEGVGCVDLEQGCGFVEQACDGDVVHEDGSASRSSLS